MKIKIDSASVMVAFMIIVMVVFGYITIQDAIKSDNIIETYPLKAITNSTNIEGNFFLGSGNIDEDAVFYFYYYKDGALKLSEADACFSSIYEYSGEPYVEIKGGHIHKFYIPPNSITSTYELDIRGIK